MKRHIVTWALIYILAIPFLFLSSGCGGGETAPSSPPSPPQIVVSSHQITNGNVVLDNVLDQSITVRNTGSLRLTIGNIAQANTLALPFSIVNDSCSGRALSASGSCTFQVRFQPPDQLNYNDSFDIPSNDPDENPVTVTVSGTGKALRVTINQIETTQCPADILRVFVTVLDKNNNPKTDLQLNFNTYFDLFENGAVNTINNVTQASLATLSVAVAIDSSTSMDSYASAVKTASHSFIASLPGGDKASIMKFATAYNLLSPFTDDHGVLDGAIETDYSGDRNETHLYDTLWYTIEHTYTEPSTNVRAIVVISDGQDDNATSTGNGSVRTLSEVIAHAKENGIAIFTIGLGRVNGQVMSQLANETSGQYFYAPTGNQLTAVYTAIRNILKGQYLIEYNSSLVGNTAITWEVKVNVNGEQGEGIRQGQGCP
jgi:VWFA-related protein